MEEFNLLDYVIEGIEVFSVIHNTNKQILRIDLKSDFPVIIGTKKKGIRPMAFNRYGSVLKDGRECLLFPDKDTCTWEGYVTPEIYKQGEVVKAVTPEGVLLVAIYSHFDKEKQLHYCYHAIRPGGDIELKAWSKVNKMDKRNGYLYCKTIYSRQFIGKQRARGSENKKDGSNESNKVYSHE
jgi:hypothetical protein